MLLLYTRLLSRNWAYSEFNKEQRERERGPLLSHPVRQDNTTQLICQLRQAYYLERRLIL